MQQPISRCDRCRYWDGVAGDEGWCRRHSPRAARVRGTLARWPLTLAEHWCGEFVLGQPSAAAGAAEALPADAETPVEPTARPIYNPVD
jgi:hypothetical protein